MLDQPGVAQGQADRPVASDHPGRFHDRPPGHRGYPLHRGRVVVLDMGLEPLEAGGPLLDKLPIVELLLDHDLGQPQGQGQVGPGPDLEPQVGLLGQLYLAGVDDQELGPFLHRLADLPGPGRPAHVRVGAPDDHAAAVLEVRVQGGEAKGVEPAQDHRHAADVRFAEVVGGAEGVDEAADEPVQPDQDGVGSAAHHQRLGAVLAPGLVHVIGGLVQGLVPADLGPLALALGPDPPKRLAEALGVVDGLVHGPALAADKPLAEGVPPIALHALQAAALGLVEDAAVGEAVETDPAGALYAHHSS